MDPLFICSLCLVKRPGLFGIVAYFLLAVIGMFRLTKDPVRLDVDGHGANIRLGDLSQKRSGYLEHIENGTVRSMELPIKSTGMIPQWN